MVTASTYQKQHILRGDSRLAMLQSKIFEHAEALGWRLQAWAVFSNHYHFVALAPEAPASLAFEALADRVLALPAAAKPKGGLQFFFRQLLAEDAR